MTNKLLKYNQTNKRTKIRLSISSRMMRSTRAARFLHVSEGQRGLGAPIELFLLWRSAGLFYFSHLFTDSCIPSRTLFLQLSVLKCLVLLWQRSVQQGTTLHCTAVGSIHDRNRKRRRKNKRRLASVRFTCFNNNIAHGSRSRSLSKSLCRWISHLTCSQCYGLALQFEISECLCPSRLPIL